MESIVINDTRKKVLLLYTGGTMGMVASQDGSLAPQAGYLTDRINELPEMTRPEMPIYHIKEYDPLMDSSCMGPKEWQMIATDIETSYLEYDGFVVIMGTDTMAYAASALSFMLENLGKTVVFTGSQIPFCEVYNDARRNLIVSIIFAISSDFPEVCICFNDKLLRANRAVKVNSVGLAAYDSPNFPPLATLGAFINENRELALPQPRGPFRAHKTLEAKVIVIKLVPGFDDECISALVTHSKKLKALVLEMYGTGNGPSEKGGGMIYTHSMIDRMIMMMITLLAVLTKQSDCKKSFSSTKFEIHKNIKHKSSYKKPFIRSCKHDNTDAKCCIRFERYHDV
jgi:L-asparaginase